MIWTTYVLDVAPARIRTTREKDALPMTYRTPAPDDGVYPDPFPPCEHTFRLMLVMVGFKVERGHACVPEWKSLPRCILCGQIENMPADYRPPCLY